MVLALTGSRGTATDLSPRALEVARQNARRHGVLDRITFVEADLFVDGSFDLVISNPPYVSTTEMASLPLEGGADGLEVIRRIVAGARAHAPRLLLEIGASQGAAVRDLALQSGFRSVQISKDLDGFDRVVEAS